MSCVIKVLHLSYMYTPRRFHVVARPDKVTDTPSECWCTTLVTYNMCMTYALKRTGSSLVGLTGVLLSVNGSCLCCDTGDEVCIDPLVGNEILGVIFGVYHFIIRGLPLKVEPFLTTWVWETQVQKRVKKSLDIVYSSGSAAYKIEYLCKHAQSKSCICKAHNAGMVNDWRARHVEAWTKVCFWEVCRH